jgi:hypothetical protein
MFKSRDRFAAFFVYIFCGRAIYEEGIFTGKRQALEMAVPILSMQEIDIEMSWSRVKSSDKSEEKKYKYVKNNKLLQLVYIDDATFRVFLLL